MRTNHENGDNLSNDIPLTTLFRYLCRDYKEAKEQINTLKVSLYNANGKLEAALNANEKLQKKYASYKTQSDKELSELRKENNRLKGLFDKVESFLRQICLINYNNQKKK